MTAPLLVLLSFATVVDGTPAPGCALPSVVSVDGPVCTGVLIHPRVVATAAHCGSPHVVGFGDRVGGAAVFRRVERCEMPAGEGFGQDVQLCLLRQEAPDIPVTPPLAGCEVSQFLVRDAPVVMAGFGRTHKDQPWATGGKRMAKGRVVEALGGSIRVAGEDGVPCKGDSGGPLLLQLPDLSWRVAGIFSTGSCEAGEHVTYEALHPHLATLAARLASSSNEDVDVTPCFDADGTWTPGPLCGGFWSGDALVEGNWLNACAHAPRSNASDTCGPPSPLVPPANQGCNHAGTQPLLWMGLSLGVLLRRRKLTPSP